MVESFLMSPKTRFIYLNEKKKIKLVGIQSQVITYELFVVYLLINKKLHIKKEEGTKKYVFKRVLVQKIKWAHTIEI
ncbi:hypothetical protein G8D97_14080 [Bacillus sp. SPB7]|uniref:hypothetical protein n=1 Tax=Bacillus rugosus TaxID=2715209 RepID=UPI001584EBF1|nr:hypothetical protein [Bacillus rugosus]NUF06117.1 hypothetical protein [Bacillus rugosus]